MNRMTIRLLTIGLLAAAGSSLGCRSGLSWPLASRGPSSEALAGQGPSTTYPVPPSHQSTPQAIASVAGGTATPPSAPAAPPSAFGTRLASAVLDAPSAQTPSARTPSAQTPFANSGNGNVQTAGLRASTPRTVDYAAAAANGFDVPPPPVDANAVSASANPSPADVSSNAAGNAAFLPTDASPPTRESSPQPSAYSLSDVAASSTSSPAEAPAKETYVPSGGMSLPESALSQIVAADRPTPSSTPATAVSPIESAISPVSGSITGPATDTAVAGPAERIAGVPTGIEQTLPGLPMDGNRPYSPGSTSSSSGYPAPRTQGTFYR